MTEFNKLCKKFEEMDALQYSAILAKKSAKVLPVLSKIGGSRADGAIAADGRLSEEEYLIIYPLLHAFFGEELDYETCKSAIRFLKPESKELNNVLNDMIDMFGLFDEDLKDDLIIICMLICAIDGKITPKEKNWLKELIA